MGRYVSTRTRQSRQTTEDDDGDFRPPWVYSGSRFLTYTTIPREAILLHQNFRPHPISSDASLLRFPRRLGRARTYLYAGEWPDTVTA